MRALRRWISWLLLASIAAVLLAIGWSSLGRRPQDLPWTPLDLGAPICAFTGRKLTALGGDPAQCRALLDRAGVRYRMLPPRSEGPDCGYDDGVRLTGGGASTVAFRPAGVGLACPVAATLAMWNWDVVQPAALRMLGSRVVTIDHFGSYNCRRIGSGATGPFSEHAHADAIDIAGFRLADGTRIAVARDWHGAGGASRFLHAVRDGACRLFATTLSPDYNAAHHDHLHLDQARRGAFGGRACR